MEQSPLISENSKLKRIVADLSLDKAMLQYVLSKKLESLHASVSWPPT
jgi:putative transposase